MFTYYKLYIEEREIHLCRYLSSIWKVVFPTAKVTTSTSHRRTGTTVLSTSQISTVSF